MSEGSAGYAGYNFLGAPQDSLDHGVYNFSGTPQNSLEHSAKVFSGQIQNTVLTLDPGIGYKYTAATAQQSVPPGPPSRRSMEPEYAQPTDHQPRADRHALASREDAGNRGTPGSVCDHRARHRCHSAGAASTAQAKG